MLPRIPRSWWISSAIVIVVSVVAFMVMNGPATPPVQSLSVRETPDSQEHKDHTACRDRICDVHRMVSVAPDMIDDFSDWLYGYLGTKEMPLVDRDKESQLRRENALWAKFTSRDSTPLLTQVMDLLLDEQCIMIYQREFSPLTKAWHGGGMARDWRDKMDKACKASYLRLGYEVEV